MGRGSVTADAAGSERLFATAEERRANEQRRRERQARAARIRARRRWHDRLAKIIAETRSKDCACPLHADMSSEDLVALGAGCTGHGAFVCPRLATVRRRVGL